MNNWTIELGEHGWVFNPTENNWEHIIITSNSIFVNGELLAKGRLKLNKNHKLFSPQNKPN